MAKGNPTASPELEQAAEAAPALTLQEFCARLSETLRRPELIGAFHHRAASQGLTHATAAEFQAAFDEFVNTPV